MTEHFADKLLAAIDAKGSPVCVGIDPVYDRLPEHVRKGQTSPDAQCEVVMRFCREVINAVAPIVPAVKLQSAYFEQLGDSGTGLYFLLAQHARNKGLIVIGDVKRNDIGSTAEAYAAGHLLRADAPDAITVNGYLGADGITPFIDAAKKTGKGVFVLVRTSNASAATLQDIADANGVRLFEHVANMVAELGDDATVGKRGYSLIGAVVGATWPDEARRLRELMPNQLFLVPGYGAQGASAADCAASFKADGTGAIVNASRSVLYPAADKRYADNRWPQAVAAAAQAFADDIAGALKP